MVEVEVVLCPTSTSEERTSHVLTVHVGVIPIEDQTVSKETNHSNFLVQLTCREGQVVGGSSWVTDGDVQKPPISITYCLHVKPKLMLPTTEKLATPASSQSLSDGFSIQIRTPSMHPPQLLTESRLASFQKVSRYDLLLPMKTRIFNVKLWVLIHSINN